MATRLHTGTSFGLELAKSLGLETENLKEFTLRVACDDVVTVDATYYVVGTEVGLTDVVKKFEVSVKEKV